jgi:quercetin dioxygenase-like cupin family protein
MMNQAFVYAAECQSEPAGEGVRRKVLAYGDQLMMAEVHFEQGAVGALHSHPHTQLTYILEGEFEFEIGGVKSIVRKGDTLYKQPHVVHGCTCLQKGILLDTFNPYRADFVEGK